MNKTKMNYWYLFLNLALSLILLFVFGSIKYFSTQSETISPFQPSVISVEPTDMSLLQRYCDSLEVHTDDNNVKNVKGSIPLSGSSLSDVVYTGNTEDDNVTLTFESQQDLTDGSINVNLNFDFGDYAETMEIPAEFSEEEGSTVFTYEGKTYVLNDELKKLGLVDNVEECFFFSLFFSIIIAVTIVSVVQLAIDAYKYFTTEEVTVAGVLTLVCEGFLIVAGGGIASVAANAFKAAGKAIVSTAKSAAGKYLVKESGESLLKAIYKSGTEMVKNAKASFNSHPKLTTYFNDFLGKRANTQVHHIVEQRGINIDRFGKKNIHNTGNAVRIPTEMHQKINGLYSSKNASLFKQITGKNSGSGTIREYMDTLSFDDQYEAGMKIIDYFKKIGKYTVEMI